MTGDILRGQVYWVALDPVVGAETAKTRPCVVLSINEVNKRRKTVVVVPLTSTPGEARFPLLIDTPSAGRGSKARPEQIRNIDKSRIGQRLGHISDADLHEIGRGVATVLALG